MSAVNEKCERLVEAAAAILNAAPEHRLNAVVLQGIVLPRFGVVA